MKAILIPLFLLTNISSWGVDVDIPESKCSPIDIREKMEPEMQEHFSTPQNQDSIGWCYAFSAADLLTAEMNEPISSTHISAIFNKGIDNSTFMKLGYDFGRLFTDNGFNDSYEGGWVDRALKNAVDEKYVCSDEALPFDRNHPGQTAGLIRRLEDIKERINNREPSLQNSCLEIRALRFYGLSVLNPQEIYSVLEQENMNTALSQILEKNCKDNMIKLEKFKVKSLNKPRLRAFNKKKISLEKRRLRNRMDKYFEKIGDILSSGKPMGVSYDVSNIMNSSGGHASVLTARRWKNGKCQFKIRNSWGEGCRSYDMDKIEECNYAEGSYWVDDQKFYDMVTDIDYIGN